MSYRFLGMQYSKAINVRLLESRHYVLRQNNKQQTFGPTTLLRFCESCQNGRMGELKQALIHSSPLTTYRYPSLKVDRKREKFATTRWPPLHCRRSLTPSTLPSPQPAVLLSPLALSPHATPLTPLFPPSPLDHLAPEPTLDSQPLTHDPQN